MKLNELMAPTQAAQALTGVDDAARRAQGNQGRQTAIKAAADAIDTEQHSTDPLDRRIAQARSNLAMLLQQKARLTASKATGVTPQIVPPTGQPPSAPQ